MKNKWLLGLLILIFIKGLVWLALTPIFQIPDEPSHLSYVQFLAENRRPPHARRELKTSQELLAVAGAVNFDWKINHPVWQGYQADWREKITAIDKSQRQTFETNQYLTSLKRPGVYYYLAAGIYQLFSVGNFFWRFYAVRLFSLVIHLLAVWLVFLTAKKILKNDWSASAVSAWVGFQPGLSFLTNGVSYESLAILAATVFFYLVASGKKIIWLIAAALIGIMIKPDLIFLLFLLPFLLPKKQQVFAWISLISIFLGFTWLAPVIDGVIRGKYALWFDQWFYFFLKIVSIVSLIGLLLSWSKKINWLVFAVLIQAGVVIANGFLTFASSGQLYGIQGRYFYPAIGPAMILFVLGLSQFISPKILVAAAISLNLIGLFSLYQYFGWVW